MSRRRGKRQDPDAVDVEQERVLQNDGHPASTGAQSSQGQGGPKEKRKAKKASSASLKDGDTDLVEEKPAQDPTLVVPVRSEAVVEGEPKSEEPEEMTPVSAHPFWSDKAKAELALAQARPSDLDTEAKRFADGKFEGSRPVDLEERQRSRQEVRVDDMIRDPDYSPLSGMLASASGQEDGDVEPPSMHAGDRSESILPSGTAEASEAPPFHEARNKESPEFAIRPSVQQRREEVVSVEDEQAVEIARLRSMVDYLQDTLQNIEDCKSYESSSNQAMDPQVAVQDSRPKLNSSHMGISTNTGIVSPPLPLVPYLHSPQQEVPVMPVPPVFNMASKPVPDPFRDTVSVHGQLHRWVKVGDKLYLEPMGIEQRESSPPPPPPKTTPPPSPPPTPITFIPITPTIPAPEEPNPLALVVGSADPRLSGLGLGDQDGIRSGAQSYLSVESGGYENPRVYLDKFPGPTSSITQQLASGQQPPNELGPGNSQRTAIMNQVELLLQGKVPITQFVQAVADQVTTSGLAHRGNVSSAQEYIPQPLGQVFSYPEVSAQLQGIGALPGAQVSPGVGALPGAQVHCQVPRYLKA